MSFQIDKTFVSLVSNRLNRFKWIRQDVANCRCPYCGDSKKSKSRSRGYFHRPNGNSRDALIYSCRNCGAAANVHSFLSAFGPDLLPEYRKESFKDKYQFERSYQEASKPTTSQPSVALQENKEIAPQSLISDHITPISKLPADHRAVKYIQWRKIPEKLWIKLFHTDNFEELAKIIDHNQTKIGTHPRLVIPFMSKDRKIKAIQGRAYEDSVKPKYLTIKVNKDVDKVYGVERINQTKPVYVLEGPIDSMFVDNAVATSDSNLLSYDGDVYIYDNQPRNEEIVNKLRKTIEAQKSVVIFEGIQSKDINSMIMSGEISEDNVMTYIHRHTYKGALALMKFNKWKQV